MKDQINNVKHKSPEAGGGLGVRHVITVTLCACLAVNYIIRTNLSVAIVAMTNQNRTDGHPVFDWGPEQTGLLLSSFFTGYLFANLAAGFLVTKYSNKMLLLCSVSYSTFASLVTPTLCNIGGFYVMFFLRVTMGLVQGFMMPATQGLLSKWIPPNERSRCGSVVLGGLHIGTIISFLSSGYLSDSRGGWPSVFYFSSILSAAWCLLWYKYGADNPQSCSRISESEKIFINKALNGVSQPDTAKKIIPWKKILTSKPVYALAIDMIGQNWGYWILITQIPSYFAHVLNFNTSTNGTFAALPFVTLWLISFPISFLSDYFISRNILSITSSRKLFNTIGQWGAAGALLCLAYTETAGTAVAAYAVGVTMIAFTFVGFNINVLDIAPNFAGLLMGLTNGVAHVTAIAGPAFVGFAVQPLNNVAGWKTVFLISALLFFLGNLVFIIFGTGEVQDFNNPKEKKQEESVEAPEEKPLNS